MKSMNRLALLALFSSLTLVACGQGGQQSAEDQSEQTMEQTEETTNDMANEGEDAAETGAEATEGAWEETKDAAGEAWDETQQAAAEAGDFLSNAAITARVKAALADAAQVDAMNINVETVDGVVVLSGVVASEDIAELAAQIAAGVEGVKSVENDIEVQSY
ncbi:BON domain-containing protein [Pseudidiomarina insulisalsae]|uniref:BON domain-containing protein n=1 Tax=Pseudidiomarina insulisalsae TaxID=575789 RepID=A0A432YDD0_9GAMM|nr:BON domain-containing protein [Pseudidiomarina insulisalsae]RUO58989.1 hypothetical protein CWI71_09210 [Pseudidiomarina insulisalsae]